jgi:CubicO group peptidase (beta-lactamase class C family)
MRKIFPIVIIIAALFFLSFSSNEQVKDVASKGLEKSKVERIDKVFSRFNNSTPGVAVGIVKEGELVYKKGFGLANMEYNIPITSSSVFHIASISKQFTAMCIVLLAQQGKLSLEDDIRKYLPEVPDFGETITIRHLANHTSGLRDQWDLLVMAGWRYDCGDLKTQEDVLDLVSRQKELNFKPGEMYYYSNTGFTLMAIIVQRVSGKSLREFADEHIFKPLGMNHTHFHNSMKEIVKNRAYAYAPLEDDGFRISIPNYETYGATSLHTTIEDFALWANNFEHKKVGGEYAYNELLRKGILNNGEEINYALGISHGNYKGLKTIGHSGGDAGYRSQFTMFPEYGISIIIFANGSSNAGNFANQVADILLEEHIKKEEDEKRVKKPAIALSKEELMEKEGDFKDKKFGRYISIWFDEKESKLKMDLWGYKSSLVPLDKSTFRSEDEEIIIKFIEDEKGKSLKLEIPSANLEFVCIPVTFVHPTPSQLKEYSGAFYSEELDVTCYMEVKDDALMVKRRKFPDDKLIAKEKDIFLTESGARISFTRDKQDKVNGCTVTTSRVWNLRFDKK